MNQELQRTELESACEKAFQMGWKQGMTDAAAIARKYEPDEKQYYVNYASVEIEVVRDTKLKENTPAC